jgi:RNA polymerase sigma-54 factor
MKMFLHRRKWAMRMDFNLSLTQEQKLIMTQQMQLSVKLLQMSSFELQQFVEKELQENPVLESKSDGSEQNDAKNRVDHKELVKYFEFDNYSHHSYDKDDEEVSPFNFISNRKSLKHYLFEQILELSESDFIKSVCEYIVDNLDEKGYLDITVGNISKDINVNLELAEKALVLVQSLEPLGIGARDIKECLKIQLQKRGIEDNNIYNIIDNYLEYLAENKYPLIAKEIGISPREAQAYGDIIKSLEPKPSRGFYTGEDTKYITPDAYIKKIDNQYFITMNDDLTPRLSINSVYKEILLENADKDAVDYVKEKMNSAMFLIKSIDQRKSTIYRVLEKIVEMQREYFDFGENYLKPMTLKEIADELGMHESTISRAIRDKYIYASRGLIKVKDMFTTGIVSYASGEDISTKKIKSKIKELIDAEDKNRPLSDQNICDILNETDMNISRRTVAKYREEMCIKASSKRKRL